MKKGLPFILSTALVFMFIIVSAYSQEDMTSIDSSAFEDPQRVPCVFPHDEHNEKAEIEECNTCHHVYENGTLLEDESSEDQGCSDCHELKASGNMLSLMKAYHTKCKKCHRERKAGPIMCGECHIKKQ
ncbi:MAG: cytochrome c3 family protein [Thermodesulfobacteriota bacterium]|nr:cytochrome c3 family protein [Thermodesulfobacteriota bacterium]